MHSANRKLTMMVQRVVVSKEWEELLVIIGSCK